MQEEEWEKTNTSHNQAHALLPTSTSANLKWLEFIQFNIFAFSLAIQLIYQILNANWHRTLNFRIYQRAMPRMARFVLRLNVIRCFSVS